MSTRDYYAGWDFERTGPAAVTINGVLITFAVGTYAHVSLESAIRDGNTGTYTQFAIALQSASAGSTVSWDPNALAYTISRAAVFSIVFGATDAGRLAARILGFQVPTGVPVTLSGAASYTSTRRAWYVCRNMYGAQSFESGKYEPSDILSQAVSNDGERYTIARATSPKLYDWQQYLEVIDAPAAVADPGTPVFRENESLIIPWSWERLFETRGIDPVCLYDAGSGYGLVFKFTQEGGFFRPTRHTEDYAQFWDIPFRVALVGFLS